MTNLVLKICLLTALVGTPMTVLLTKLTPPKNSHDHDAELLATTEAYVLRTVHQHNSRLALEALAQAMAEHEIVTNKCHGIVHKVGREAYRKYQDVGTALSYMDPLCTSGYTHGVLEEYFSQGGKVLQTITTICDQYPKAKFIRWQCNHGVGHGLMYYTANNLPRSLSMCDQLTTEFDASACYNGVFMENFNADQVLHPSDYVSDEDPFHACRLTERFHHDCYMNAPIYFFARHATPERYILEWCTKADETRQPSCYFGAGAQALRHNLANPSLAEKMCQQLSDQDQIACLDGMVTYAMSHFGSVEGGQQLCQTLSRPQRPLCDQLVQKYAPSFD